ncbi:Rdx family-domain-containing protein [Aspergillus egyptiacus]|nr:Rdx family-domain-containing protein [Aspergillus egyptiacus]
MTEPTPPIETNPPTSSSTSVSQNQNQTQKANGNGNEYPRITIQYCTQCKWMLRAAYFAQELLSTFSTDLGEVALVPRTGGVFTVTIFPGPVASSASASATSSGAEADTGTILWDRKRDGGFPEVKVLKSRVRNVIDPSRDLGHTDRALRKGTGTGAGAGAETSGDGDGNARKGPSTTAAGVEPAETSVTAPASGKDKACEDCQ